MLQATSSIDLAPAGRGRIEELGLNLDLHRRMTSATNFLASAFKLRGGRRFHRAYRRGRNWRERAEIEATLPSS